MLGFVFPPVCKLEIFCVLGKHANSYAIVILHIFHINPSGISGMFLLLSYNTIIKMKKTHKVI